MPDLHIIIVDDDSAVRDSLSACLERDGRRITCFPDGESLLAVVEANPPDILFLDLKMPGISGLDVLRRLAKPTFPVVMISAHADISIAVQAIKLGASNFIEKPFEPEIIEYAIREAQAFEPSLQILPATDRLAMLTERERDIALALNDGLTNKEVGYNFDISPRTVEIHRARVFEKLGVRNVAGLVRILSGRA